MDPTQPRDGHAEVNGVRLHYLEWGGADRDAVVCLHGLTGEAGRWERLARALSDRFRVVAVDQRGHGDSGWARDGYDPESYVADLDAFLGHLRVSSVALVGLSLGGMVCMDYAGRVPQRVSRAVAVDISPAPGPHVTAQMHALPPAPAVFESLDAAVAWASDRYLWTRGASLREDLAGRLRRNELGRWAWKADPRASESESVELWVRRRDVLWRSFAAIRCPLLAIRGVDSDVVTEPTRDRMRAANHRCEWIEIEGAGHNVVNEQPEAFATAVREFLVRTA